MEQQRDRHVSKRLRDSIEKLERWVEARNYQGYEPFDGLSSFLKPLTFQSLFLERILQQIVRQSPINLRPLFGIRPQESTKGRGYMAWGYLARYRTTSDEKYAEKARQCLTWLAQNKSPGYEDLSWGNHFQFSSRGGRLPRLEPIIVWTSLIGQAYMDAFDLFGEEEWLDAARSICRWILALPREVTESGTCLSYVMYQQSSIHNSNMLGAAMLARTADITGNQSMMDVARQAMEYSCSRQLPDGSWYYAEGDNYHWIDNFHTGYNLDSLKCYMDHSRDKTYSGHLQRGLEFFMQNFFEDTGRPKYYHNRAYPIDSQCAAQAIETLANFSTMNSAALPIAVRVADWTIENMQDSKGYFYYRQYPLMKARTPMLHWAQATTYRALALLQSKLRS